MQEPLLSRSERIDAASQVRGLITSSGQAAVLLRKQAGENLYGTDEGTFAEICTFPLEINEAPPVDLTKKVDAIASVLPEIDVRVCDRVHFGANEYRVQAVTEESLFGTRTHKVLDLVLLR